MQKQRADFQILTCWFSVVEAGCVLFDHIASFVTKKDLASKILQHKCLDSRKRKQFDLVHVSIGSTAEIQN